MTQCSVDVVRLQKSKCEDPAIYQSIHPQPSLNTGAIAVMLVAFGILIGGPTSAGHADETHVRYFEQLRQRGLLSLAEGEAISRLTADNLSLATRTSYSIELSKTLTEHAGFVSDEQREDLWGRARSVIQDLLDEDRTNPRAILLLGQLAAVSVSEGDWLRAERMLRPFDDELFKQARHACTDAIELLKPIEKRLSDPPRESNSHKLSSGGPTGYEIRSLLHQVRWQMGLTWRNLAELTAEKSPERAANLTSADQTLRRITGAADEPLQTRAKLLLITCSRLKGDFNRGLEQLVALEKADPNIAESVQDEMIVEKAHLLLGLQRATEVVDLLVKTRAKRQRLTGEQWFLQTMALIALREITLEKEQETISERLAEQITTSIQRCKDQVGGFWSRRCGQLWENAQTSRKYGLELDAMMQRARMSYTSGKIPTAREEYAAAETVAREKSQTELAMELGFTRASILLEQKQNESGATEFLRIAAEYPKQARTAKAHLLGAYSLGRLYDEKPSQDRRDAYSEALDRHLKTYPDDATVNEARFLKAQLEEQRSQPTEALNLYLQIDPGNVRAPDAISGVARCYEIILRRMIEKRMPTNGLEQEAIDRLTKYLSRSGNSVESWTETHADVALRLVSILLISASKTATPDQSGGLLVRAGEWMDRISAFVERKKADPGSTAIATTLQQRMIPSQIIILAGSGKVEEADQLLSSLPATPATLLSIMDSLNLFVSTKNKTAQSKLSSLQLKVAEKLMAQKGQLSEAQLTHLHQNLIEIYMSNGQVDKAVETIKRIAESSPKDADKQRQLALRLEEMKSPPAMTLAKQCWRRVESIAKPGSTEWLSARLAVIRACVRLNQWEEGRKLMQVTKVLYPGLGGDPLVALFEEVEKELKSKL